MVRNRMDYLTSLLSNLLSNTTYLISYCSLFKGIVAHSTVEDPHYKELVAAPCCMYASRFSINTPSQLALISLVEYTIVRIRGWI